MILGIVSDLHCNILGLNRALELMGDVGEVTGEMARKWLATGGKRWRPFLAVCAYQAFRDDPDAELTDDLKRIAIAVECFHKASLIHDDIEDEDDVRYGEPTVHAEHGIPVALNLGDYLIGEGYRLIAESSSDADKRARMLHAAAIGHRTLSVGQGGKGSKFLHLLENLLQMTRSSLRWVEWKTVV